MNTLVTGLVSEVLTELVVPVLGTMLLAYGTLLAAKIKKKTGVDITEKLNALLHKALERGAQALIEEVSKSSFTDLALKESADKLTRQIMVTMPDTLKGLGSPSVDTLRKLSVQALERAMGSRK